MIDLKKFEEQIELEEAKKELCLISDRTKDFKKVEATILTKEYFAYKNKYTGWTITDKASGLALKSNFNTLVDARDYLKTLTPEELEKINEVKSTEKYKDQCAKLATANIDDYELYEDYCIFVMEALEETSHIGLFEAENINKESSFKRGIKYDSLVDITTIENDEQKTTIGLLTDLDMINDAIEENSVSFLVLARLFDIYINNRSLINETDTPIVKSIWKKLKHIIDAKIDSDSEAAGLSWYKKLQYYYNAYVSEEAVKALMPNLAYGTSPEEHSILYCNKVAEDLPDFTNFIVKGVPMTLEIKNYGSQSSADKYVRSDNRADFHNTDFILYYIMSQKKWRLAYNSKDTKIYSFTNIPLQKPHINIEIDQSTNKFIISEWN